MNLKQIIRESVRQYINEQEFSNDIWYHGGESKIKKFLPTQKVNRVNNVEGFYFTSNLNIAKNYGNEVTYVKLKIKKPFILGKTIVSKNIIEKYAIELHKENPHLPLDGSWIKEKCQYFKDNKIMPFTDMDSYIQQKVFKSDGFDSVIDGHEIAVFDSDDIIVLDN